MFTAELIKIDGGKAVFVDPPAFEKILAEETHAYLEKQQTRLQKEISQVLLSQRGQLKSKIKVAKRMQSIWFLRKKVMKLHGIRTTQCSTTIVETTPEGMQGELEKYWKPIYSEVETDQVAAKTFLELYKKKVAHRLHFAVLKIPDADLYRSLIPKMNHSNLRTLFQSNTDNKIVSAAINNIMIKPCLRLTPTLQRGICPGRQFILNAVVLDAFMRVFNFLSVFNPQTTPIDKCPITALYDLCNAFPSIAHAWLFAVLKCIKVSPKILRIILHLYTNTTAYTCGVGTNAFIFVVLAGVKTGCTLSATLFLIAFNTFLELLSEAGG